MDIALDAERACYAIETAILVSGNTILDQEVDEESIYDLPPAVDDIEIDEDMLRSIKQGLPAKVVQEKRLFANHSKAGLPPQSTVAHTDINIDHRTSTSSGSNRVVNEMAQVNRGKGNAFDDPIETDTLAKAVEEVSSIQEIAHNSGKGEAFENQLQNDTPAKLDTEDSGDIQKGDILLSKLEVDRLSFTRFGIRPELAIEWTTKDWDPEYHDVWKFLGDRLIDGRASNGYLWYLGKTFRFHVASKV